MGTGSSISRSLLAAVVALLGWGAGCVPGGSGEAWNVVIVMVDTLRADHLSLYGHHRETSPVLERFARGAQVFTRAQSQAGCTFPSANSLLTSRSPFLFVAGRAEHGMGIPPGVPSIARLLSDRGYSTLAVSASPVVRVTPSWANDGGGYGDGFDTFDETCFDRQDASCVNGRAFELMEDLREPFFAYLHYMDPHAPYHPPLHHVRRFPDVDYRSRFLNVGNTIPVARMVYKGADFEMTPADVEQMRILYDEEIRYFDRQLEGLLGRLEERGALERTLVVLLSDHGEELLDHGHIGHCRSLAYQTVLATPLVLYVPGEPGAVRPQLAQNLDVVPTVMDYLGFDRGELGFEGRSLRPAIEEGRRVNRYAFASQGSVRTVRDRRFKLMLDIERGESVLYDLEADPGETVDVAAAHPRVAEALASVLEGRVERLEGSVGSQRSLELGDELQRHLEAVGYL